MNLLAIDTSTERASVALHARNAIISKEEPSQKTHAQLVLPMIDDLMSEASLMFNQLDAVIFGCGPGSFTGLRIACSIAKGIAYAHNLGLIPVSSLSTIAWRVREQLHDTNIPVLSVLDARMHELYWAYFTADQYHSIEHVSAAAQIQVPQDSSMILAGVGMNHYWPELSQHLGEQVKCSLELVPMADAMIRMVLSMKMKPVSAAVAQPVYVRNQVTHGGSRG